MECSELPIIQDADLVVSAVEKFAQVIPLNLQEIFLWYFEQKGVDNPERFLGGGVNDNVSQLPVLADTLSNSTDVVSKWKNYVGQAIPDDNPENQLSQDLLPKQPTFDINTLTLLLGILQQVNKEKGAKAKPEDFINVLENAIAQEQENNNEV